MSVSSHVLFVFALDVLAIIPELKCSSFELVTISGTQGGL